MLSSNQLVDELGAQTSVDVSGSETISGALHDQQPSGAQNIVASDSVALQSVATARSITSTRAMAQVTGPVVITT